ncbi:cytochrome P450 [Durotheca rogersii]|uniref:cytochrome P450 n=1 Tax=Durotheca rogersii TaxID=419775 RepID=UPI00221E4F64|nr:cytochrome P450 [Durotheca rogersii]KAI5861435.1 cytochrome P450 [Durotheca rogersii]
MLGELLQEWWRSATGTLILTSLLLLWRLWVFSLKPKLWPSEPKEMPYWIPFIGHTFSFFGNYVKLIEDGLNATGRTREPFAIQLLGKKLYICTSPADVSAIFDNTVAFNFDVHLTNLLTSFGISSEGLRRSWHEPKPGDWCYVPNNPINPKQKCLIHCVEDIYKQQLLPGERMDKWCRTFLDSVQTSLRGVDDLRFCTTKFDSCVWCSDCTPRDISLYSLVSHFNVQATTRAMFGPHLHELDPSVVDHMLSFNEHVWMVVFRYPNVFGLPVDGPRRKLMAVMRGFVQLPPERRGETSWAIASVLAGMETVGMDVESKASMVLMIYWAAVSNEHNSCFWLLAHLLYDEPLLARVRRETEAAWRGDQLDIKRLCASCPALDAAFNEVLRLNNAAAAVRVASRATVVSGKVLRAGATIVLPFRQLHRDETVWGADVERFDAARFLRNRAWARSASFRPFGGGATLCPGQTLARHEVFGFVAVLLRRFRLTLARPPGGEVPPFPPLNSVTPSFGLNGPMRGTDVIVNVAERSVPRGREDVRTD